MNKRRNPGCYRPPVLPKSSSTSSTCTICSLTPPSKPVTSSCGEVFCFSCLLHALSKKHQDEHQEPAIQEYSESRHEGDLDLDGDNAVLLQEELSEMRREQIEQLQQLEDNMEQLRATLVCALGLKSVEDRAWVDEAIAKERLETRREIAWLEALNFHAQN